MTTPVNSALPAGFLNTKTSLTAGNTTAAKVLVDTQPAAAATGSSPLLYGGASVIAATVSSTDAAAQSLILWGGSVLTTEGGSTGAMTTTTSTIVRASGSFIADGWRVGDAVMVFAAPGTAPNAAVDGILGLITSVSALTLTVNGTPFAALTLASGSRICKVAQHLRMPVPAGAGTNGTAANVSLLGNTLDASVLQTEIKLGASDLLAVSSAATLSALPAYMSVSAQVARY
jgi:hypothetical protein